MIVFEGDYVVARGSQNYQRVTNILNADYVQTIAGQVLRADESEISEVLSEKEYRQIEYVD